MGFEIAARDAWGRLGRAHVVTAGLVVVVLVVLAVAVVVRTLDQRRDDALSLSVRSALENRDLEKAKGLIDGWAAQRPGNGAADYFQAELAVRHDDPVAAMDAIRRALDHGYPEKPLEVLRAVLQARAGKFDAA